MKLTFVYLISYCCVKAYMNNQFRFQKIKTNVLMTQTDHAVVGLVTPELEEFLRLASKSLNIAFDFGGEDDSSVQVVNIVSLDVGKMQILNKKALSIFVLNAESSADIYNDIRTSCSYDFWLPKDRSRWSKSVTRFGKLIERLRSSGPSQESILLDCGLWSHFISLTFPSMSSAVPLLEEVTVGADAVELRVDLLESIYDNPLSVHDEIAVLRENCPLPIVFTVRSDGQIGKFPSDPTRIFSLLREGLRAGAEYVDVEACWPEDLTDRFCALASNNYERTSRLLGSLHVTSPKPRPDVDAMFAACALKGRAAIAKVVSGADGDDDARIVHAAGESHERSSGMPYIGLCLGVKGQLSRVLNQRFTPVCHPAMAVAAPGQLSAAELMERRRLLGLPGAVAKQMFLFGSPIAQSLSPGMHNAAFKKLLLPHNYSLSEKPAGACGEYLEVLRASAFGGASVTIPHKEAIMPLLDEIRGAAADIGAVNTVLVEDVEGGSRRLVGLNTDWLGILQPVLRQLKRRGLSWEGKLGLVVGAGGTAKAACYAVKNLGLKLVVYNRTPEKAAELADRFGGSAIGSLEDLTGDAADLALVVSTLPAAAALTLPPVLLAKKPVVLDVVYKPARTPLLDQALSSDCLVVQGATMLHEQAMQQFQLWTKRRAPAEVMKKAVFCDLERLSIDAEEQL